MIVIGVEVPAERTVTNFDMEVLVYATGGGADDVITGGGADDVITGGGADDAITGGGADDVITGGGADDVNTRRRGE